MRGTESPGGDLTALIEKTHCANFILFGGNCINPEQVAGLIQRTNEYNPHEDIPFFYCIDEEGGRVSRLKLGLPSAKETALSENPAQKAYENGEKTANALREIGIQWDLAPVFDISKGESALGDRIFGSNGETAGALALSFARGLQENGVAATAKHFPGIGHTPVDSHEAFPVIEKSREELESYELVPFRAAMDNNVDVIMVGHVIMPAFDTQYPATISHKIITGLLREEWGYNGLIMTDDMAMSSMKECYPAGEACLQAVLAGVDMVLIADNSSGVFDAMQQAARDGVLTRERLEESMRRILAFKWQYQ